MVLADLFIRRVEKHIVELPAFASEALEAGGNLAGQQAEARVDIQRFEVLANEGGRGSVLLDENHLRRPAAQSLQSHGARSRVGIEKGGARDFWAQDIEEGLPQLVRGGAKVSSLEGFQTKAAIGTGDDSHKSLD